MVSEKIDILLGEVTMLNDLIAGEQDERVVEELKQERTHVVAGINNLLGTDHIVMGSKIVVINSDCITDLNDD